MSLYAAFVSLLAGGWDLAKKVQKTGQFGVTPKLTVLTKLAGKLQLARKRDFNGFDFRTALKNSLPGLINDVDALLTELVQDGLIMPVGADYVFSHLSYQEYLAAKTLLQPNSRVTQAIRAYLGGDDWWKDVITFYIGLSGQPQEIEQLIHNSVEALLLNNADNGAVGRAHYLLEDMMTTFPGCSPSFQFNVAALANRPIDQSRRNDRVSPLS